ncbi:MAG: hypothetical protein ACU84Q_13420, partial [Gammaproteobacteria bacterium]
LGLCGCAKDALNRALYDIGEQATYSARNANRIDGESRRVNRLATAIENNGNKNARQQHFK